MNLIPGALVRPHRQVRRPACFATGVSLAFLWIVMTVAFIPPARGQVAVHPDTPEGSLRLSILQCRDVLEVTVRRQAGYERRGEIWTRHWVTTGAEYTDASSPADSISFGTPGGDFGGRRMMIMDGGTPQFDPGSTYVVGLSSCYGDSEDFIPRYDIVARVDGDSLRFSGCPPWIPNCRPVMSRAKFRDLVQSTLLDVSPSSFARRADLILAATVLSAPSGREIREHKTALTCAVEVDSVLATSRPVFILPGSRLTVGIPPTEVQNDVRKQSAYLRAGERYVLFITGDRREWRLLLSAYAAWQLSDTTASVIVPYRCPEGMEIRRLSVDEFLQAIGR